MKALGIGARVWVGWCADNRTHESSRSDRLLAGTIIGGPYPPGMQYSQQLDELFNCKHVTWSVRADAGQSIRASEYLLTPIDDGDGEAAKMNDEREVTA